MTATRTTFHGELEQIETLLHEEGALVLDALDLAIRALLSGDPGLADRVIAADDAIDQRYIEIEEGVQRVLALQTPVAGDLRLVLAILHTNLHLERMGDQCVNIAKLTKLTLGLVMAS
ncbi:MAG: phosphate signaling complex PhoU family protein, partial [Gaiellales bacterium]